MRLSEEFERLSWRCLHVAEVCLSLGEADLSRLWLSHARLLHRLALQAKEERESSLSRNHREPGSAPLSKTL